VGLLSQEFVLDQVHPLNYILARLKDSSDVLRVDGSGEMGIAEMAAIVGLHAQFLKKERNKGENVSVQHGFWQK